MCKRVSAVIRKCGITLVGHMGAGKTALSHSLIGKSYIETQSTIGIELSECIISKSHVEASDIKWEKKGQRRPTSQRGEDGKVVSEMTLWDMSGEFAFYKTHQMFLFPSNVFLLVMDITKGLDEILPQSCATKAQKGNIECPRTPREFLDYWMNTICTFVNTCSTEVYRHVIIVLTHTDLIAPGLL